MHYKDDPTNCDDDSNHDDGRDIVCMTRMISTVHDDTVILRRIFGQFRGSWGGFWDQFGGLGEHCGTILGSCWRTWASWRPRSQKVVDFPSSTQAILEGFGTL